MTLRFLSELEDIFLLRDSETEVWTWRAGGGTALQDHYAARVTFLTITEIRVILPLGGPELAAAVAFLASARHSVSTQYINI